MSVTAEQQGILDLHNINVFAIYQQGVVAEVQKAGGLLKKAKTEVLPRIITLTTYRLFIFNVQEKKFLEKKGKHLIEIKYLDLTGLETDGKKLVFQFEQNGANCEHTIRTDRLTELITHIRQQRRKHLPYAAFNVVAPSDLVPPLEEYKPVSKTSPYLDGYKAWCNYYQVPVNQPFVYWIENMEIRKSVDFDMRECPGIETSGPLSLNVTPVLMALKNDTYFRSLTITKVSRKEVVPLIAEICKTNHVLTKLVIVDTDAESHTFMDVGTALKNNSQISLQIVDISMNKFTDKGLAAFASAFTSWSCRLTHLKLNNCNFGGKGLEQLFQAFQMNFSVSLGLVYLNLHGNKIDDSAGLVLDTWIDRADEHAHLETLVLSATNIGVQYLAKLRNFKKLTHFDFSENPLTPVTLRQLSGIFEHSPSISHINLALCGLTSQIFETFMPSLVKVKSNVFLNISGNPIGLTATEFKGIARYFKEFHQLTGLDLSGIPFKETVLPELFDSLKGLSALSELLMDGIKAKPESKDALNVLVSYPALTKLSVAGSFSRDSVVSLVGHARQISHKLTYFDVSGTWFGDEAAPTFAEFLRHDKLLQTFKCEGAGFSVSGWQMLYNSLRIHPTIKVMTNPTFELLAVRGINDLSPSAADAATRRAIALNLDITQYWYLRQKAGEGSFFLGEHPFASLLTTPLTHAAPVAVPAHLPGRMEMSFSSLDSTSEEGTSPPLGRTASRPLTPYATEDAEDSDSSEATTDSEPASPPMTLRGPPPPLNLPPPPTSNPPPPMSNPPPPTTNPPPPLNLPPSPTDNGMFEFDDPDAAKPSPPMSRPTSRPSLGSLPKLPTTPPPARTPSASSLSSPRGAPPSTPLEAPPASPRDRPMPPAPADGPALSRPTLTRTLSTSTSASAQPKSPMLTRQQSVSGSAPKSPLPAPPKKQPPTPPAKAPPPTPGAF